MVPEEGYYSLTMGVLKAPGAGSAQVSVDGKPLGAGRPGPLTTRIRKLYWDKREAGWRGTPVADLIS